MRTFLVFLAAYVLSQFFRSFLAVVAPDLAADLGLTPQQLGNISAAWFWTFALAQLAVGWSLDRHGPRLTMPALMLAAVAGAAILAGAGSYAACLLGMVLIGLGSAPIYMSAVYTFARREEPARLALLSSWLLGLGSAGNLLSARPLASAIEAFGWRETFLGVAAATLLVAALALLLLPPVARVAPGAGAVPGGFLQAIGRVLSLRRLWPLLPIVLVSHAVMLAERGLWVGPYLAQVHGLGQVDRGNTVLLVAAAMSAGALAYGPLDRLLGTRKWLVFWGSTAAALLFLALGLVPGLGLVAATALLVGIGGTGMTYAVLLSHARAFLPDHLLGRGITVVNLVFFGGAGLLQPLSGALVTALAAAGLPAEQVFGILHTLFGALLLGAALLYLLSEDRPP